MKTQSELEELYNLITYYRCGKHMKAKKRLYNIIKKLREDLGYKKSSK